MWVQVPLGVLMKRAAASRTFDPRRWRGAVLAMALALGGVAGHTSAAHAGSDHCIFVRSIDGFNTIGNSAVIVYTGPSEAYRVDVAGYCYGLRDSETIAFDSNDGMLCWPSNSHIITSKGHRCMVTSVLPVAKEKPKPPTP